jgi:hypothetical protein
VSAARSNSAVIDRRYSFSRQNKRHRLIHADPLPFVREIFRVADHTVLNFKLRRRCAHIDHLVRHFHEFIEIERPIIEGAR